MTLGVAIAGYGYWGPNLARNFAETPGAHLRLICEPDDARRALAQKRHPAAAVCPDFDAALNDDKVGAVCLAVPTAMHCPMALKAMRAGKHVLVEKPMAASVAECEQMAEEAGKREVVLLVDYPFVYSAAVDKLRELCAGELGKLLYFDSRRVNLGKFQSDVSVLWDLAVHDLSILERINEQRPRAVCAIGAAHLPEHPVSASYITLFFDSPFIAHVNVSWIAPVKQRLTEIVGDKKMAVYDDTNPDEKLRIYDKGVQSDRLRVSYRSGDLWVPRLEQGEALAAMSRHFVAVIDGKENPRTGAACAINHARILERAEESIRQGGERLPL